LARKQDECSGSVKADLLTEDLARRNEMRHPPRRPRDAASLLLIDRQEKTPRVLVGKRGKAHAFMPDVCVSRRPARPGRQQDSAGAAAS
jgi:hypothetical protein